MKLIVNLKITFLLIIISISNVLARNGYSQVARISLEMTLEQVMDEIEKQNDFYLIINQKQMDVNRLVDIQAENEPITDVLPELFNRGNINYAIPNRKILLTTEPLESNLVSFVLKDQQQQITVTGRITNPSGDPLPGATVIIKGTTRGTITDTNGNYLLENVPKDATLVFSFVGMQTQEIQVDNQTKIDVTMQEKALGLEEVIVVGYGTTTRKEYPGSVSSVKVETSPVSLAPNFNVLESLKGNVSGLNIGASNTAGGQPSMLIRGQNSISGSNDPLIILDGVIYLGSLNDINPNDITTIDILKDAVSAAAYGSRSANGIIAITTKRGRSSKPLISFNTSAGIQLWQNRPEMMKGEEWIKVVNARNQYPEGSTSWMKTGELNNLAAGKETNWLDEVTRTGVIRDYQLSVSGTGKGLNYYLSTSYNTNKGIILGDDFERISVLGKVNADITSWLQIGVDASYSQRDYSGFAADLSNAYSMSPYGVMYRDEEGHLEKYPYTQSAINPLWGVNDGTRDNTDFRQNFRLNSYGIIKVPWVKGLSYRINFVANLDKNRSGNFYHESYYVAEGEGLQRYAPETLVGFLPKTNGNIDNNHTNSYIFDNIVNYRNTFGRHTVEGTLVATRDYRKYDQENSTGSDFAANGNTALGMWGIHYATVQKVNLNADERSNIGYLGRISYSYNNKYYLTTSYRHDGASVFGKDRKWGNFAALGVAWTISEENFMQNFAFLNFLKLKLSWGQNGNQGIGPYTTLARVATGPSGGYRYEFSNSPGKIYYGLVQSNLANDELGWESTESWNTGFESRWLTNRLSVDADIYFSKTSDQIFTRNIPVMTGFKTITTSMGQVNNSGVELTLNSVNIKQNNLMWSTSFTFWKNWNKLIHLYGEDINKDGKEDDDISNSLFIGKSLGAIYGYVQDGIVQEDDIEYMNLTGAKPGYPKYKDIDGTPGITANDRTILGYTKPNFNLNMGNDLSFRNFDLYVMIVGIFGGNNYFLQSNPRAYLTSGTGRFNDNMTSKPYWTPENKSNKYPSATFAGDGRFLGLQSRGFVRIQDITLSYTFNQTWIKAANIEALKIFFAAKNLVTLTNWDGPDPETGATYLSSTFPVPSAYSIGLNISF